MTMKSRTLFLCAGLQSGGTTLISWCFLQRPDMDGILDANNDIFAELPPAVAGPHTWLKTTISSFRLSEQIAHFQDLGWIVRPLLVCRDVRDAYASLRTKRYGINGTTAEDPPLRLRLRRFREDWELFHANDWPILRYEQFLIDPEEVLAEACARLELPWADAMLTWPKPKAAIFNTRHGNETFRQNQNGTLWTSILPSPSGRGAGDEGDLVIPAAENLWLETEFARYNAINGYPAHRNSRADLDECDIPCFAVTRRAQWLRRRRPWKYLFQRLAQWLTSESAAPPRRPEIPPSARGRQEDHADFEQTCASAGANQSLGASAEE